MNPHDVQHHLDILHRFVGVYCHRKHQTPKGQLCEECRDLLAYAKGRLEKCPFDPKPKCKACPVHCYRDDYRMRIKEIMKFAGLHFVKRGRLDWLMKYLWSGRAKQKTPAQ